MKLRRAIRSSDHPLTCSHPIGGRSVLCVSLIVLALISMTLSGCSSSPSSGGSGPFTGTLTNQSTPAGVTFKFQNLRPVGDPTFITFGGGGALAGTNLADNTPLVKGTSYPLSSLASGVNITTYADGRIYLSIGSGLTTPNAGNGYAPNYNNPNLGDFTTRWDKIELTIGPSATGTTGGVNLTSQDFFGLPLDVTTTGGSQAPAHLTWHTDTATVFTKLGLLSNNATITIQNATGAIALGNNGVNVPGVGNVTRVISPGSVAPKTQDGKTVYQSLAKYVSYLQTGNPTNPGQPVQTQIAGHNGQIPNGNPNGGPFQTYNLIATISNSSYTVNGANISPGDLVFTGPINSGSGDVNYTILVPSVNLTDTAIYGANPGWQILVPGGAPNPNNIVQKITADYFAALNFGFVGSTVNNVNMNGTTIGASPSWTWYGNQPSGQPSPKLPISTAFNAAQPQNSDRYNLFADYLIGVTDSYGFAYNDRLELPLAAVSDGTTVLVSILPDSR